MSERAAADNDHPIAYPCPSPAQSLLATLYINGKSIRSKDQGLSLLEEPIRQRMKFVSSVAVSRGVTPLAAASGQGYIVNQWMDWYQQNSLSKADAQAAVNEWKQDAPMSNNQAEKINNLIKKGTKSNNKKALLIKKHVHCARDQPLL